MEHKLSSLCTLELLEHTQVQYAQFLTDTQYDQNIN